MTMKPGAMNRKKPNYQGTLRGASRFASAVATGGQSELRRAALKTAVNAGAKAISERQRNANYKGGRVGLKHGGQPSYKHGECPKAKAN